MAKVLSSYEVQLAHEQMPAGKKNVLIAALHLFARQGFSATTTAAIAKEAGVSEGTIYKYFSSKKDLLVKLITPLLTEVRNNFFTSLGHQQSLDKLVSFVIKDRLKFAFDNFELLKILLQEALTSQDITTSFTPLISGKEGLATKIEELKATYPEINQALTPVQIIRIFLAPMLIYVGQVRVMKIAPSDQKLDRQIIHAQIMAGLTTK